MRLARRSKKLGLSRAVPSCKTAAHLRTRRAYLFQRCV
jgi:hypothetical protein